MVFILLAIGIIGISAGNGGWMCWFLIWLSIIYLLMWIRYYYSVTKIYKKMSDKRITVSVGADNITIRTSEHLSVMKWSLIKKVWSFPDVLLLFTYGHWNYVVIPVVPLGEELKKYVEDRVREHGGKVCS